MMSKRKPHNGDAGYIAERVFPPTGSHIVIYDAYKQGMDNQGGKYAVVCSKHHAICNESSVPRARVLMRYPEFCEECMAAYGQRRLADYYAVRQEELIDEAAADAREHTDAPFEYEALPEPPD